MTVIEKQYMESVISINRELKKPKEIDWEQREYDLAKELFMQMCGRYQLEAGFTTCIMAESVEMAHDFIKLYKG
mgnify:CR=1 FL=1